MVASSSTADIAAVNIEVSSELHRLTPRLWALKSKEAREENPDDFMGQAQQCHNHLCVLVDLASASEPLTASRLAQLGWTDIEDLWDRIVFALTLACFPDNIAPQTLISVCKLFDMVTTVAEKAANRWHHAINHRRAVENGDIQPIDISQSCVRSDDRDSDW